MNGVRLTIIGCYLAFCTWSVKGIGVKLDETSTNAVVLKLEHAVNVSLAVLRRGPSDSGWTEIGEFPASASTFTNSSAVVGTPYFYNVYGGGYNGFVYGGLRVAPKHSRGKLILLVDESYQSAVSNELTTVVQDLTGDGWTVIRHAVPHSVAIDASGHAAQVLGIRSLIKAIYDTDPEGVKGVFLFGHPAVPFSGDSVPGGHPEEGAVAADGFYTDMSGLYGPLGWCDSEVDTDSQPYTPRTGRRNVPGDGKFDQAGLPGGAQLFLGCVDMENLSGFFAPSATELLRRYLNKDHAYRFSGIKNQRGLIKNTIPGYFSTEYHADTMYSLFGSTNSIGYGSETEDNSEWFQILGDNDADEGFLWAVGYGFGSDYQVGNVADSARYAVYDPKAIFISHFGSYFGDYDFDNNILRSALATTNYVLGADYGGGGMHKLGLGSPAAECLKSVLDGSIYSSYGNPMFVWLGDPTIRPHIAPVVSALNASVTTGMVTLTWSAPSSPVDGYFIYRGAGLNGPFALLNSTPVTTTNYSISQNSEGVYVVKSVSVQQTGSGSYSNLSQGEFAFVQQSRGLTINESPRSSVTTTGRVAVFAVAAEASTNGSATALSYQWRRSGTNISDSANKIEGATRSWLAILNVNSNDAGTYDVVVSAGGATQTSSNVTLSINNIPEKLIATVSTNTDEETSINIDVSNAFQDDNVPNAWSVALVGFPLNSFAIPVNTLLPQLGDATVVGQKSIHYAPKTGKYGEDSFRYIVSDGLESTWGTIAVQVDDTSLAHDLRAFGWQGEIIGEASSGGSRVLANGKWEVRGGGFLDEVYSEGYNEQRNVGGDFEFIARVESVLYGGFAGIVVREDLTPESRLVVLSLDESGNYNLAYRTVAGGGYIAPTVVSSPQAQFPDGWIRLVRDGDSIRGYASTNGTTWSQIGGTVTITNLTLAVRVGMACEGSFEARGVFSSVQVKTVVLQNPARQGNGYFVFDITNGLANTVCGVDVTTNMISWQSLGTVTTDGAGKVTVTDTQAAGKSMRFYRVSCGTYRSLNSVGFVERRAWEGYSLSAVQVLNPGFTSSTVAPLAPADTVLYAYSEAGVGVDTFDGGLGDWDPNISLGMGNRLVISNPATNVFTLNFVGEAPLGKWQQTVPGGVDDNRASLVPARGGITSVLGYVPSSGDTIYRYLPEGTAIDSYDSEIGWDPEEPVMEAGEAFVIHASGAKTWTQELQIWP